MNANKQKIFDALQAEIDTCTDDADGSYDSALRVVRSIVAGLDIPEGWQPRRTMNNKTTTRVHQLEKMVEKAIHSIGQIDESESESTSLSKVLSALADLDSKYTEYVQQWVNKGV